LREIDSLVTFLSQSPGTTSLGNRVDRVGSDRRAWGFRVVPISIRHPMQAKLVHSGRGLVRAVVKGSSRTWQVFQRLMPVKLGCWLIDGVTEGTWLGNAELFYSLLPLKPFPLGWSWTVSRRGVSGMWGRGTPTLARRWERIGTGSLVLILSDEALVDFVLMCKGRTHSFAWRLGRGGHALSISRLRWGPRDGGGRLSLFSTNIKLGKASNCEKDDYRKAECQEQSPLYLGRLLTTAFRFGSIWKETVVIIIMIFITGRVSGRTGDLPTRTKSFASK